MWKAAQDQIKVVSIVCWKRPMICCPNKTTFQLLGRFGYLVQPSEPSNDKCLQQRKVARKSSDRVALLASSCGTMAGRDKPQRCGHWYCFYVCSPCIPLLPFSNLCKALCERALLVEWSYFFPDGQVVFDAEPFSCKQHKQKIYIASWKMQNPAIFNGQTAINRGKPCEPLYHFKRGANPDYLSPLYSWQLSCKILWSISFIYLSPMLQKSSRGWWHNIGFNTNSWVISQILSSRWWVVLGSWPGLANWDEWF